MNLKFPSPLGRHDAVIRQGLSSVLEEDRFRARLTLPLDPVSPELNVSMPLRAYDRNNAEVLEGDIFGDRGLSSWRYMVGQQDLVFGAIELRIPDERDEESAVYTCLSFGPFIGWTAQSLVVAEELDAESVDRFRLEAEEWRDFPWQDECEVRLLRFWALRTSVLWLFSANGRHVLIPIKVPDEPFEGYEKLVQFRPYSAKEIIPVLRNHAEILSRFDWQDQLGG